MSHTIIHIGRISYSHMTELLKACHRNI